MNWKTAMYIDLWTAQGAGRQGEHDRAVRTLEDLIIHQPKYAELWRRCLAKLEEGYDL